MLNYVYLAGPMSGISFDQANDWRVKARKTLPYWVQPLSPLRAKPYLTGSSVLGDHDNSQILCTEKAITDRDYNDVKRSSVVLVNFLESTTVSIGTVMEIAWAKALNIPCVLIIEKGNIHQHAMINASCGFFCTTLKEGIDTVAAITGNDLQVIKYQKNQQTAKITQRIDLADAYKTWANSPRELEIFPYSKLAQERTKKYNAELMQFIKDNPVSYSSNPMKPLESLIPTTIATDIYHSKTIEDKIKKFNEGMGVFTNGKSIDLIEPNPRISVQTRFPTDNASSTGIDYNSFLNNPIFRAGSKKELYPKWMQDAITPATPTKEDLKERNIKTNIKAPAPKEDRVLTFDELLNLLLLDNVIQDLDKELSSKK